jgi:hypothetical protein
MPSEFQIATLVICLLFFMLEVQKYTRIENHESLLYSDEDFLFIGSREPCVVITGPPPAPCAAASE